mgnify:CR=1 FL=1
MQLVAVPFTPTYAEYIYLKGRRVLAESDLAVIVGDGMADAAEKVVAAVGGAS